MKNRAIIINRKDNVATALTDLNEGEKVRVNFNDKILELKIIEYIPIFHKFMLKNICVGEKIIKYGEVIGEATCKIKAGELVHTHNVKSLRGS